MLHSSTNRLVSIAERVAIVVLISYLCVHTLPKAWKSLITDFPDYYLTARLVHEGVDTSRIYDWRWLEREKDHRGIDVQAVGIVPLTPFSTLFVWPLASLAPLTAKHVWILFNLLLTIPIALMLRSMTGLTYQRIVLIFVLCFPFYRNLEYGQFYIVLLAMIVSACWMYVRGMHASAGVLVAIAAACKLFPILLFVLFFQRRSWRALVWGTVTGAIAAAISIGVFGWSVHRTYIFQVLPWALHGEAMPPYAINGSISSVLHVLFLGEPQWNPNPWHPSILAYSLLLPALQMVLLAPAILLIRRNDRTQKRILLEWSAMITASLAVSTLPASYHFVLMVLPMCALTALLLERRQYGWLALLLIAFLGIVFPMPHPPSVRDPEILLYVPRLILMIAVLVGSYALMGPSSPTRPSRAYDWTQYVWAALFVISVLLSSRSTFLRESAVRQEYAYRLPLKQQGLLNADPQGDGVTMRYVAFTVEGYRLMSDHPAAESTDLSGSPEDVLSFTGYPGHLWLEHAESPRSKIVDLKDASQTVTLNGRNPMSSNDGRALAYIRDDLGRGQLMVHTETESAPASDRSVSPSSLNVYEASFKSEKEFAYAASDGREAPELYLTDATHSNVQLGLSDTRYPALSPDGLWLAYSHLDHGVWNIWIRNEISGFTRRVSNLPCNQIEPSWEDSKTVVYSTDCGRSLWFTAVARRRIVP